MKTKSWLVLTCLLCSSLASAQFNRTYLSSLLSPGNLLNEPLVNVVTDQNSFIRIVGQVGDTMSAYTSEISFSTVDNAGSYQSVTLYNNQDESNYKAQSLIETPEGDFILVGSVFKKSMATQVAYAMKTDASGNVVWAKNFPGVEFRIVNRLESDSIHDYFLLTGTALDSNSQQRVYCVRIDEDGTQQWAYLYGSVTPLSQQDIPNSLALTDSSVVMVGTSDVSGDEDLFALVLLRNGVPAAPMRFYDIDNRHNYQPYILADTLANVFYLSFTTNANVSGSVTFHGLIRLNGQLNADWTNVYWAPHSKYMIANMVQHADSNTIITAGTRYNDNTGVFEPYTMVVEGSGGSLVSAAIYPQDLNRFASSFTVHDPLNLFILHTHYEAGMSAPFDLIMTDPGGLSDCYTVEEFNLSEIPLYENSQVYARDSLTDPNERWIYDYPVDFWDINCDEFSGAYASAPAGNSLQIAQRTVTASPNNQSTTRLAVYNLHGQLVLQLTVQAGETVQLRELVTGVYILRYTTNSGVEHHKHFIE